MITDWMIENGIAKNVFNANAIFNGLQLKGLRTRRIRSSNQRREPTKQTDRGRQMNRLETTITIILTIIVIAASIYVINSVKWFDLTPCPAGQQQIVTVWNEGAPTERTDTMCIEAEK